MATDPNKNWLSSAADKLEDLERLFHRMIRAGAILAFGVILLALAVKFAWVSPSKIPESSVLTAEQLKQIDQIEGLKMALTELRMQLETTQQDIKAISQTPASLASLQLKTLITSTNENQKKLSNIESIVLNTPSKALDMPMLHRDFDNLKTTYQADLAVTRQEVDRVYDQNKWFLGVMITTVLAVIGLVGTTLFRKLPA